MDQPQVTLNDGTAIPQLGFGVFQVPPEQTQEVVRQALAAGYRHIDTATRYENEEGVGAALAASGLGADEVFVTTKLSNPDHGYASAQAAIEASRQDLGRDAIDLYLIHWPSPGRGEHLNSWRAITEQQAAGRIRSVGVSNYLPHHLEEIFEASDAVPAVNQIELHPYMQQGDVREFHAKHGIVTEAYSPLGQGLVLQDPVITAIGERHGRTPAQVVLRWHLQLGNVVIPKTATPARMAENIAVFDFELTDEEMARIAALDRGERIGFHPDEFNGYPEDYERLRR